jgi:hypothetical protein
MKKSVRKIDECALRTTHPIVDRLPGWFFRVTEICQGAYRVDGTDAWGRAVSAQGEDPDALLVQAIEAARAIQRQIDSAG